MVVDKGRLVFRFPLKKDYPEGTIVRPLAENEFLQADGWGVAKGSSISWVAKLKGDKSSECKLSNGWSRSYREIKMLLSAET